MRRREFLVSLAGASSLSLGVVAHERKLPRLAMVHAFQPVEVMSRTARLCEGNRAFLDELARLGYVEGETIRIDRWTAAGKPERFAALAQEVAQSRPDVIHVIGARLAQQLKAATSEIPIVAMTADPVEPRHLIRPVAWQVIPPAFALLKWHGKFRSFSLSVRQAPASPLGQITTRRDDLKA